MMSDTTSAGKACPGPKFGSACFSDGAEERVIACPTLDWGTRICCAILDVRCCRRAMSRLGLNMPPYRPGSPAMLGISSFFGLLCLAGGCADRTPTLPHEDGTGRPYLTVALKCTADTRSAVIDCEHEQPGRQGISLALLGSNYVKLRSSNVVYDTTVSLIWSMDVTVQNLMQYAIGTPDGYSRTGLKVFFETGPTVTAYYSPGDTGTVTVWNPDGLQNITAHQQPYHFYDTILSPQATSLEKRWEFHVPSNVARFAFTVRVFTRTPQEEPVADEIPDLMPSRYLQAQSYRWCDISGFDECVYDAVVIKFRLTATDEERRSAVDMVHGTVEGGSEALGRYYVRIPRDTTLAMLRDAITRLRALPQVERANPFGELPGTVNYLRPTDGPNWMGWQLDDSLNSGRKWALEVVGAPWAWGCETGSSSVPVAVVDNDFYMVSDLQPNSQPMSALVGQLTALADTLDHGTFVSSIIGAVGNNGTEMTGVAWNTSVRLYEVARANASGVIVRDSSTQVSRTSTLRMAEQVRNAARDGAAVINLSMGVNWSEIARRRGWITSGSYDPATETNPARIAIRDTIVFQVRGEIDDALGRLTLLDDKHPLIIISAGNDATDAQWNPFATAASTWPNHVLVVGAGDRQPGAGGLAQSSYTNFGNLVEIAAPGTEVWGLVQNGQLSKSGTSFAAPHVAGAAALLISFDRRLEQKPDSVKQLLLSGARAGGRWMRNGGPNDSIPVLSIYESLRATAGRAGAPLCGTRVWAEGDSIYAERDNGVEPLAPVTGRVAHLDVSHGGSRIDFIVVEDRYDVVDDDTIMYDTIYDAAIGLVDAVSSPHWVSAPLPRGAGEIPSGFARSVAVRSHDGDTVSIVTIENHWLDWTTFPQTIPERVVLNLTTSTGSTQVLVHEYPLLSPLGPVCGYEGHDGGTGSPMSCRDWITLPPSTTVRIASAAYSPRGDYILVSATRYTRPPPDSTALSSGCCSLIWRRDFSWTPAGTDIWKISLPSLNVASYAQVADSAVFWMGFSEDAKQAALAVGRDYVLEVFENMWANPFERRRNLDFCAIEYRASSLASRLRSIQTNAACPDLTHPYGARMGSGGGGISPDRSRAARGG